MFELVDGAGVEANEMSFVGPGSLWQGIVRPVQARPRQQPGPAQFQAGVHAISVVLDLMTPFRASGRHVH
jgi:hypothetical protein